MISNRCARKSLVTSCNSIISKSYLRFLVDSNDTNNKVNAPIENKGGIMLLSEWGIMWDYEYYYWFGIYGKSTKHLPVKVGNNTFDWTLDKQGYPTKCVFHRADGMQAIYTFEWE